MSNDMGDDSIDRVILDIDMGYGPIWEMTEVSIWSSPISVWDMLSLCMLARTVGQAAQHRRAVRAPRPRPR